MNNELLISDVCNKFSFIIYILVRYIGGLLKKLKCKKDLCMKNIWNTFFISSLIVT
jgi:hypothetical protein